MDGWMDGCGGQPPRWLLWSPSPGFMTDLMMPPPALNKGCLCLSRIPWEGQCVTCEARLWRHGGFCCAPLGHSLRPSHYVAKTLKEPLERFLWRGTEASHQQQAPDSRSWIPDSWKPRDNKLLLLFTPQSFGVKKQWIAAAKSLQSCLTLCDPIDGSPPGSPIPGIL